MKTITFVISAALIVLIMAMPAEAQNSWDIECNRLDAQANNAPNGTPRYVLQQLREAARQCWTARWDHFNQQRAMKKRGVSFPPLSPSYGGGYPGYGQYYDPRLHDLKELPPLEIEGCKYMECAGQKGTFHTEEVKVVYKGKKTKAHETHFRAYDSTHDPAIEKHKTCKPIPSAGYLVREDGFAIVYHPQQADSK